ncbi:MAG: NfeD family protein [Alkalispirochaeta sp.]
MALSGDITADARRNRSLRHLRRTSVTFLFLILLTILSPATVCAQEALLLPIHGPIDRFQTVMVQRAVERARDRGHSHLIIDIDTFGGRVDAALEIAGTLGGAEGITTVAFVGNSPDTRGVSWSAGALIALAANEIYMAPGTSIGAAAPVMQGPQGSEPAGEKTVSAVRGQMAALAERNGHPPAVARAMVDSAEVLVAAEVDGEVRLLTEEEASAIESRGEQSITVLETVSEEGKLLTLTAGEMERYGVSRGSPRTPQALVDLLGIDGFTRIEPSSTDRAVSVLTGTGFTTLLILAGLVALFLEITSPGFGVPGAVALTAFATLFASNLLLGRVGSLEIILFVLGVGLLIFELFVIPGFGVAGISGLLAMGIALILSLQRFVIPQYDYQWDILGRNVLVVGGTVVAAVLTTLSVAMLVKNTRFFSRLALANTQDVTEGYTVQTASVADRYLNREGTAETTFRPSGKIRLDEEVLPAESEGGYIEMGRTVRIVRVDGNRVVVREV